MVLLLRCPIVLRLLRVMDSVEDRSRRQIGCITIQCNEGSVGVWVYVAVPPDTMVCAPNNGVPFVSMGSLFLVSKLFLVGQHVVAR